MSAITDQVEWIKKRGLCGNDQLMKMMKLIESQEHAIAEKDREIQQIREHEYQRGYQEAEEKYQQILDKSVNTEGATMTSKEELKAKARQFMETQDQYPYLTAIDMLYKELLQVEREVLERVDRCIDEADHMGDVRGSIYSQLEELT